MPALQLNHLYGEYLEHSLRYYLLDSPVVSDAYYDGLCQTLLASWGAVTHKFKHLTDEGALSAGSGFQLKATDLPALYLLCKKHNQPLKEVFNAAD